MNPFYKIIALVPFAFFSHFTSAICIQQNNSLTGLVGVDNAAGTVYAALTSSSNECSCTGVRFTASNADTEKALSVLLAAKMADKKVRIDLLTAGDCNTAYRVYLH